MREAGKGPACQASEILLLGLGGNRMRFQGSNHSCPTHQGAGSTKDQRHKGYVFIPLSAKQMVSDLTLAESVQIGKLFFFLILFGEQNLLCVRGDRLDYTADRTFPSCISVWRVLC